MTSISSVTAVTPSSAGKGTVDPGIKAVLDELNDDSGAVSSRRKAEIMDDISRGHISFKGSNKATSDYLNSTLSSSTFFQRGRELSHQYHSKIADGIGSIQTSSEKFRSRLDFFKGLSEDDKVAFSSKLGQTSEDWQATMEAQLKLAERLDAARASGELGLDGNPTGKASAALSMLIEMSDAFDKMEKTDKAAVNAWTRSVNEMSDRPSAVRIDLSDDAKAYLNRK